MKSRELTCVPGPNMNTLPHNYILYPNAIVIIDIPHFHLMTTACVGLLGLLSLYMLGIFTIE